MKVKPVFSQESQSSNTLARRELSARKRGLHSVCLLLQEKKKWENTLTQMSRAQHGRSMKQSPANDVKRNNKGSGGVTQRVTVQCTGSCLACWYLFARVSPVEVDASVELSPHCAVQDQLLSH